MNSDTLTTKKSPAGLQPDEGHGDYMSAGAFTESTQEHRF